MKSLPLRPGYVAWVDDEDFADVGQFKWSLWECPDGRRKDSKPKFYAARKARGSDGKRRTEYLHRRIMRTGPHEVVDHRDSDGLNCRRYNMRNTTQKVNTQTHNKVLAQEPAL